MTNGPYWTTGWSRGSAEACIPTSRLVLPLCRVGIITYQDELCVLFGSRELHAIFTRCCREHEGVERLVRLGLRPDLESATEDCNPLSQ